MTDKAPIYRAADTLCSKPKGHEGEHGTGKAIRICGVPMKEWKR